MSFSCKSNYFTCMADAGLIRVEGRSRIITTPIIDNRVESNLEYGGEHALLVAISGVA